MCCTCGSATADVESCGRNDAPGYPVSPTTGKGAGQKNVTGLCGRSCAGKENVDTVGVFEFDTKLQKVVATHVLAEGIGGDPYMVSMNPLSSLFFFLLTSDHIHDHTATINYKVTRWK